MRRRAERQHGGRCQCHDRLLSRNSKSSKPKVLGDRIDGMMQNYFPVP
jgi:hypothetical protein